MKSRVTLSRPHRGISLAALLALGSVAVPNAGYAKATEAERALLNRTNAPFGLAETKGTPFVDGARALLGRPGIGAPQVFHPAGSSRPVLGSAQRIDGERALLGKSYGATAGHPAGHPSSVQGN